MVERLEIGRSRFKLALMVAGCAGIALPALWLMLGDRPRRLALPPTVMAVCYASLALCGLVAVLAGRRLFDASPGLVIDAEGIVDRSSAVSVGRVSWSEMTGLRVVRMRRTRLLAIDVADAQRHIDRAQGIKRWTMAANARLYGTPLFISTVALRIGFDELVALMAAGVSRDA